MATAAGAEVVVRAAVEADVDALVELERHALRDDAWSPGLVADGVRGALPTVAWLVAEVAGVVVGHAVVSLAGEVAELQRIGVRASHRRRGVAGRLLAVVLARARADGAERVLLEVREDNAAAVTLYVVRGFVEVARRPRYYRDGAAALVLEHRFAPPTAVGD